MGQSDRTQLRNKGPYDEIATVVNKVVNKEKIFLVINMEKT
jgi:hypothetical protein